MAIVYQHKRNDTGKVFYIGIGADKKRAYAKWDRNKHWYHIVNKHGYTVEITHSDIIWEEACAIEKYLISFYGRVDLKTGCLANMTDGGEGVLNNGNTGRFNPFYGKQHSEDTKSIISAKAKERFKDPSRREFLSFVHKGKKMTSEQIVALSKRTTGGNNPRAKRVIDLETGIIYSCVKEAALLLGFKAPTLRGYLNGGRMNKSTLRNYAE